MDENKNFGIFEKIEILEMERYLSTKVLNKNWYWAIAVIDVYLQNYYLDD